MCVALQLMYVYQCSISWTYVHTFCNSSHSAKETADFGTDNVMISSHHWFSYTDLCSLPTCYINWSNAYCSCWPTHVFHYRNSTKSFKLHNEFFLPSERGILKLKVEYIWVSSGHGKPGKCIFSSRSWKSQGTLLKIMEKWQKWAKS